MDERTSDPRLATSWTDPHRRPCRDSTTRLARLDERRLGRALERRSAAHLPHDACPRGACGVRRRRGPAVRLQQHPVRHEHAYRRVGPRQDDPLRAADARRRPPHLGLRLGRQASPAQLPVAATGEHPRRDGRPARSGRPGRRPVPRGRPRDPRPAPGGGRGGHADRRGHRRAADAGRPGRRGHHGPRRPAGHARRPRGQVDRRDHAAQHRLLDGRRRLPADLGAAQAGRPRERARGQRHEVPVRPRLRARRQHQRGLGRALQPASARLLATGSSGRATRPSSTSSRPSSATRPATTGRSWSARRTTPSATPTSRRASGSTSRSS